MMTTLLLVRVNEQSVISLKALIPQQPSAINMAVVAWRRMLTRLLSVLTCPGLAEACEQEGRFGAGGAGHGQGQREHLGPDQGSGGRQARRGALAKGTGGRVGEVLVLGHGEWGEGACRMDCSSGIPDVWD